jgi:hypothetical protein
MYSLVAILILIFVLGTATPPRSQAASVTIITHGLNSNIDDWVIAMAQRIPNYPLFPGAKFSCYEIYFISSNSVYVPTWRRLGGDPPQNTDSAEIIIKLDWRQLANNSYSTYQVAASVVPVLMQANFISEWPGHALAELPLHLIGHSRGGSLVCELSKHLGTNGLWLDHLTTLDPHPLNNDGFSDFPYTVVDAPARTYENVLFHDNYFQTLNLVAYGEPVGGAYVRELTNLDGGYGGLTASHSDVHLWYHGTVDLNVPADDSVATITASERDTWWTDYESSGAIAGFHYSLIGRGDRTTTAQPEGAGTPRIRDGFNQKWDLGAGTSANRTSLPANNGNWPNLLRFNLLTTNLVAHEQTNTIDFYIQWARSTNSQATVSIYTDDDFNPWNGNEHWVRDFLASGTTASDVSRRSPRLVLSASNTPPGLHSLFAKVTANGRSRYLYAPETLTVMSTLAPPQLAIKRQTATNVQVRITGVAGQRIVLETSSNLPTWTPLQTNWLTQPTWDYFEPTTGPNRRFFRASLR